MRLQYSSGTDFYDVVGFASGIFGRCSARTSRTERKPLSWLTKNNAKYRVREISKMLRPQTHLSCVADGQSAVHRYYRAGDVRSRGQTQAESDVRDFLGIAVTFERGAPLGENALVFLRY